MDRVLYLAMTGAAQAMQGQASVSHNLSNINTAGFRADLHQYRAMPVYGPGHPSRAFSMAERPGTDFSPGSIQTTGRPLDVAVNGEGWFAVQAPDGTEAYTRAGDLQITNTGLLLTGAGHPILGDGGPIAVPPHQSLEIGADGTISIRPLGQTGGTLAVVDRIKVVGPEYDRLEKREDGLMHSMDGEDLEADAGARVTSGALEGSNVNMVDGLVDMIALARRYETQVRLMNTAKEDDESLTNLMRLS